MRHLIGFAGTTSHIVNLSNIPGETLTDALNWLFANTLLAGGISDVIQAPSGPSVVRINNAYLSGTSPAEGQILQFADGELTWVDLA